jgi:hypothetical protein
MGNLGRVATWGTQSTGQNKENTTQYRKLRRLAAQVPLYTKIKVSFIYIVTNYSNVSLWNKIMQKYIHCQC